MRAWVVLGWMAAPIVAGLGGMAAGCAAGSDTEGPTVGVGASGQGGSGGGAQGGSGGAGGAGALGGSAGAGGSACSESELCNGIDDDCDDAIDEDCDCIEGDAEECFSGDPALLGIGACAAGSRQCDELGVWSACEGEVLPASELCNGLDDDCDESVDEELAEVVCGLGACQVSVEACVDGEPVPCVPNAPEPPEDCEGTDDDCDGDIDEDCPCVQGDSQPCYSGAPDTRGVGICHDGEQLCNLQGIWGNCENDQTPLNELCNGLDDDCDGTEDDGNPGGGSGCSTGLPGVCAAGVQQCVDGQLPCEQLVQPSAEICDGLDNDCDPATADGSADPTVGIPCDGPDGDLCPEADTLCNASGQVVCGDTTGNTPDVCNGLDDDCDASSLDGTEDPLFGQPCDGPDSDLCPEGFRLCSIGVIACSDASASDPDICNGLDDDCDSTSADGSEGPQPVGAPCDGADTDLCAEGAYTCSNGTPGCSDNTADAVELCNGLDDDCNPGTTDGSGDPQLGQSCDGADTDQCLEGSYGCVGTSLLCSDNTASTTEQCAGNAVDEDCNGQTDEGFVRDDSPLCSGGTYNLGNLAGDTGSGMLSDSYYNEEWDRVTILEANDGLVDLTATVSLWSPAGVDFDLYVRCDGCSGTARSSTTSNTTGHWDTVEIYNDDDWFGADDTFDIVIEVRHKSSTRCAYWELYVYGNTAVSSYLNCD